MEKKSDKPLNGVICSVSSCYHNSQNDTCTALQIEIGPKNAANCTETVCATYKPDPEKAEGRIF